MRLRGLLVCAVVAAAVVLTARSCATGTDTGPLADDATAPVASVPDVAGDEDVPPPADRVRTHVRPSTSPEDGDTDTPVDESAPAPLVDGEIPEEDRGAGEESVDLFLLDAETDEGIASRVRLWRLGVPADDRWPAGDHIQRELRIGTSERVTGLPPGRYRLEVLAAPPGTDDPPEFVVRAGQPNELRARVELPAEVSMGLRVYDENGVPIARASRMPGGPAASWGNPVDAPPWARPRSHRDPGETRFGGRRGGRRSLRTGRTYEAVEAEHGVFDLGTIRRSGRSFGWSRGFAFRFADRTDVRVRTRSEDADEGRTYVAVSVSPQPLIDAVRLPDGTRAADAGAEVRIVCEAVAVAPGDHGAWRTVPVRVTVDLSGHEELEFTWCIDDGTPLQRTLTRRPVGLR